MDVAFSAGRECMQWKIQWNQFERHFLSSLVPPSDMATFRSDAKHTRLPVHSVMMPNKRISSADNPFYRSKLVSWPMLLPILSSLEQIFAWRQSSRNPAFIGGPTFTAPNNLSKRSASAFAMDDCLPSMNTRWRKKQSKLLSSLSLYLARPVK